MKKLLNPHRIFRNFTWGLGLFVIIGLIDPTNVVWAQTDDVLKGFASILSVFVNLFTALAMVAISWGGDLLGTEFLTSDQAMSGIRPMWQFIRNITNIGFVLILLFLAFANLFTGGQGTWSIKEKLPKVIIALIAINFSLLGFRLAIDAVNVGTTALLSISDTAVAGKTQQNTLKAILDKPIQDFSTCAPGDPGCTPEETTFRRAINNLLCPGANLSGLREEAIQERCLIYIRDIQEEVDPKRRNLFLAFAVYFIELEKLPALAAQLDSFVEVLNSVLFSTILAIAYVVALIAVFVALLVRIIALWIMMVFSPLIIAAAIIGLGSGGGGEIGQKIVTNLIMPLKIAGAFAISFVMIAVLIDFAPSEQIVGFGNEIGQFGQSAYGVLWKVATIVVFWKAAFGALQGSEAEGIINSIEQGAVATGGFLTQAAAERQILPFPGAAGNYISPRTILRLPSAIKQSFTNAAENEAQKDLSRIVPGYGNQITKATEALQDFNRALNDNQIQTENQVSNYLDDLISRYGTQILSDIKLKNGITTGLQGIVSDAKLAAFSQLKASSSAADIQQALKEISNAARATNQAPEVLAQRWTREGSGGGAGTQQQPVNESISLTGTNQVSINMDIFRNLGAGEKAGLAGNQAQIGSYIGSAGITKDTLKDLEDEDLRILAEKINAAIPGPEDLTNDIKTALAQLQ